MKCYTTSPARKKEFLTEFELITRRSYCRLIYSDEKAELLTSGTQG